MGAFNLYTIYGVLQKIKEITKYAMKMINKSTEIIHENFWKKSFFENNDVINVKSKTNKVVDIEKLSSIILFPVNKYKPNKTMPTNNKIKGTKLDSFLIQIPPFIKQYYN